MAKQIKPTLVFIITMLLGYACVSDPNFSVEPKLEYIGISKNQMNQNSLNTDSLNIHFSFTDGDGDIGSDSDDINLIITDTRTGKTSDIGRLQTIPVLGASKGVIGEVTFRVYTTCCIFPDPSIQPCDRPEQYPTDTLILAIQLIDRNLNKSNIIMTEPIILLCN